MFPYTQNVGNLIALIRAIGSHGIPDKFTAKELPIWGLKSSNDRSIIGVLKAIGFLDNASSPTELWREARTDASLAVGKGTRTAYPALFQMFPDADRKDAESLNNFFKAKTDVGDAVIKLMVSTFRALAQFGNFDVADDETPSQATSKPEPPNSLAVAAPPISSSRNGLTVNLNIELSLPADASGEVYEAFFRSMKANLIDVASQ